MGCLFKPLCVTQRTLYLCVEMILFQHRDLELHGVSL
jgi:hypothetical protein